MKKSILTVLFVFLFSLSVYAQLPGIAAVDSLAFSADIANRGLVTIFPTGGITFNVPNVGNTGGSYPDVRLISRPAGQWQVDFGPISLLTPGQINIFADGYFSVPPSGPVLLSGTFTDVYLQRNIGGTWTDISTGTTLTFKNAVPQFSIVTGYINADLYAYTTGKGSSYYVKKVLDGQPNPKTLNGEPTILVFYVTGAHDYPLPFTNFYQLCPTTLKVNGTITNNLIIYNFVESGYPGLQQLAIEVPSTVTSSTTFQLGTALNQVCNGLQTPNYGQAATIPNWQ